MRNLLATAVALAPLLAAAGAHAEVVISTQRTTPIATANATGSAAADIRISNTGSIKLTSGTAITLNSNNSVDLDTSSQIIMENAASGAVGILANGGNTGSITIDGSIRLTDSITESTDTDQDGDLDGPLAAGAGRYGVRVAGAAPLVGDVVVGSRGSILVEGNDSYGISVEAPLDGDIDVFGAVSVVGSDTYAVRTTGDVTGDVRLLGDIQAAGENATGVSVEGDVGGALVVHSSITTNGFRYIARPPAGPESTTTPDKSAVYLEELDADDLLESGSALQVTADVAGGVLLDRAPTYRFGIEGDEDGDGVKNGDEDDDGDGKKNRDDTDRDGDGLLDSDESTADITTYGSAPAIAIGSGTRSVNLGLVGAGSDAYGFINHGGITAQGVYDEMAATALKFGGMGQAVTIDGGIFNSGVIVAGSREANSTAVQIGAGVVAPAVVNTGTISSTTTSEGADTVGGIMIAAGADVSLFDNSGSVNAVASGEVADAYAIQDLSGTLTTIRNSGRMQALVTATDDTDDGVDEVVTGSAAAIDVSANTTGVTLLQLGNIDGDDDGDPATTDPDADGDGVDDGDEPFIIGDVLLGSGADTVDFRNGNLIGGIAFGAGADSLVITGGAAVRGVLSDTDGQLSINVADGILDARQESRLTVSDLTVGADGDLIVTIDPSGSAEPGFNVTGAATLADGAGLGVRFTSLIQDAERFTIIDAATLNYGDIDISSLSENSPYLFVVDADADIAAGEVFVDVRRRTAAEAEMIPAEASAYNAIYSALDDNTGLRNAFLNQTGREGFIDLYEQMLPDHSGGPLLSLASGVDAVTRALTGRNQAAAVGETSAWVQEINFYADKDRTDTYGFRSEGFGVAGGVERGTGLGAIGISAAFTSSDLEDPEAEAEEVLSANLLELGLYWRAQGQHWTTWARAAGGYATFDATRQFIGGGLALRNESSWNGYTLAAAAGASYERAYGRLTIRPEAYVEYFGLNEDARVEEGGGDGFDLDIDERDGHLLAAVAAVNFGVNMGADNWLRPEFRVGWRQNISVDPGDTIARFVSGGPDFTLSPESIEGGGPIVGFRLNIGNQLGLLTIEGDAEMIDDYVRYALLLRASFRF